PEAREWNGAIRLKATAYPEGRVDGKRIERIMVPVQRRWPIANINTSRICREVCLAVRPGAPYGLSWAAETVAATAGTPFEAKVKVRRQGDFKGPVKLNGLGLPPGFGFATMEIPAGKDELTVKFTVAGNVPPGLYSVVLRGDAQAAFSKDAKAATKPMVRV